MRHYPHARAIPASPDLARGMLAAMAFAAPAWIVAAFVMRLIWVVL